MTNVSSMDRRAGSHIYISPQNGLSIGWCGRLSTPLELRLGITTPRHSISRGQSRCLSLNIFNHSLGPTPPLQSLSHIARLEADANTNPQDLGKQVALWNELIKYPAGQKRILSRYERLTEFDQQSPLIRSSQLFQIYLRALLATDQASSIDPAVRHRDAILALPPPESQPESPPLTESQTIARDVLASALSKPRENWLTNARSRFAGAGATMSGATDDSTPLNAGDKANPVHVVVEGCACHPNSLFLHSLTCL